MIEFDVQEHGCFDFQEHGSGPRFVSAERWSMRRGCRAAKWLLVLLCAVLSVGVGGASASPQKKKPAKAAVGRSTKHAGAAATAAKQAAGGRNAAPRRPGKAGGAGSSGRVAAAGRSARAVRGARAIRSARIAGRGHAARYVAAPRRTLYAPQSVSPSVTFPTESAAQASAPVELGGTSNAFLYAKALNPFFRTLADRQRQAAAAGNVEADGETVRVLQFGDSHTAADMFTGQVRARLQARFGDGGLGFQFPGHPFAGYRLAGSSRSQTGGWYTEGNKFTQLGDGDLGLGGISISTNRPDEEVTLTTTCTTLQVEFLRQPSGGRLRFSDNGTYVSDIDTSAPDDTGAQAAGSRGGGTLTYACTAGLHEFALTTLDQAPVRLLGLVTDQPGITYECLGINGAVASLMLRWNQTMFAEYLRERNPNLIVLAYGTNEAAQGAGHNEEYVYELDRLLDTLHRIVPEAAILMLGPYDRATRVGRGRHAAWQTFAGTERVVEDQREACRLHGCAFYDERARMGGPGSMIRWAAEGLAQGDHTHLTGAGYRELADALYRDLMDAYKTYQQGADAPSARLQFPR